MLTRTVADTAHALDIIGGYEVGDANWAPRPAEPYATSMRRNPGRLRIAVTADNPLETEVDEDGIEGLRLAAELLSALGHEVVEAAPAFPSPDVLEIFINAFGPAIALTIDAGVRRFDREPEPDEIEPLSARAARARPGDDVARLHGRDRPAAGARPRARGVLRRLRRARSRPGLGERPLKIGECNGLGEDPLRDLSRSGRFTPYTSLFNVTGQPAISVPVGFGADGLPTNVQIVGKPLNEDLLLQLAAQMELAHPWAHQRPAIAAAG